MTLTIINSLRPCSHEGRVTIAAELFCFCCGVPRGKKTKDFALAIGTPYLHVNRVLNIYELTTSLFV
jgi:hypothetical protein